MERVPSGLHSQNCCVDRQYQFALKRVTDCQFRRERMPSRRLTSSKAQAPRFFDAGLPIEHRTCTYESNRGRIASGRSRYSRSIRARHLYVARIEEIRWHSINATNRQNKYDSRRYQNHLAPTKCPRQTQQPNGIATAPDAAALAPSRHGCFDISHRLNGSKAATMFPRTREFPPDLHHFKHQIAPKSAPRETFA